MAKARYRRWLAIVCAFSVRTALAADAPEISASQPSSPTEILNSYLPPQVRLGGELRFREEGFESNRFQPGNDDMYLLQRIRLSLQVQPKSWMKFFVQGQDARVSFTDRIASAPPLQDSADLRQAYVEIGNSEAHLLSLRAGRQELAYGEERLVGAANWGNVSRTFDALRLGVHRGRFRLDAFASSVVVARDHELDWHAPGDNLHGLYGRLDGIVPQSKVEPYFFWRLAPVVVGESGIRGKLDSRTTGIRWAGQIPRRFEYTMELAGQSGSWGPDSVRAWAGFWRIGREIGGLRWKPAVRLELNHASGDKNPGDGRHGTFDVLYPTPHDKYGLADQVGWKNVNHIGVIFECKPRSTLVVQGKFQNWWLDSARDGLYNAGGALLLRDTRGLSGKHVGKEIDFQVFWSASKHVALGGGVGHLFPGEFVRKTSPGAGYTFPYVSLTYGL